MTSHSALAEHETKTTATGTSWKVHRYAEAESTNLIARKLPAWHAVRADTQTRGYGRTGRKWISDHGGLWISAVLPTHGPSAHWSTLPLAVGWALIQGLKGIGAKGLRLRWPNDILVGDRKLAGILLERFQPNLAVVGIGLNVTNQPEAEDSSLTGTTISLSELLEPTVTIEEIERLVLYSLTHVHKVISEQTFAAIVPSLNQNWDATRTVEVTLNNGCTIRGCLLHVDSDGNLHIETGRTSACYQASEVSLLREF